MFSQIKNQLENEEIKLPILKDFDLITSQEDYFLLSQLPQSYSPEYLLGMIKSNPDNEIDRLCLENDLKTYRIIYKDDETFFRELASEFNSHPFIIRFKNHIEEVQSLRYGGVVKWIQENCKEVPIPRSFDMKKDVVVNVLYRWICYFDSDFQVSIPGKWSEVIEYKKAVS